MSVLKIIFSTIAVVGTISFFVGLVVLYTDDSTLKDAGMTLLLSGVFWLLVSLVLGIAVSIVDSFN